MGGTGGGERRIPPPLQECSTAYVPECTRFHIIKVKIHADWWVISDWCLIGASHKMIPARCQYQQTNCSFSTSGMIWWTNRTILSKQKNTKKASKRGIPPEESPSKTKNQNEKNCLHWYSMNKGGEGLYREEGEEGALLFKTTRKSLHTMYDTKLQPPFLRYYRDTIFRVLYIHTNTLYICISQGRRKWRTLIQKECPDL